MGTKTPGFSQTTMTMHFVLLAAGTLLCASAQKPAHVVTPQMTELSRAHREVLKSMNVPGKDGRLAFLGDRRMRPLLNQGWQLAGEWAGEWFDLHPDPSAKELDTLFADFSPTPHDPEVYDPKVPDLYAMGGSATRIAVGVYVVMVDYAESQSAEATSTFFVVARDTNGHFVQKWSIKPLAQRHYPKRDEIGRWAFLDSCAYYCGPLVAEKVLPLPPSGDMPRFAVDAVQATNGSTFMKQLSVWQWNGNQAESRAIQSYRIGGGDEREIHLGGDSLLVPTKEETRSFSSFGCCEEPRGTWTIRITPDQVQDLGHTLLQPQIGWADRLLAATGRKSSTIATLASPSVVAYLRHTEMELDAIDKCQVLSSGEKGTFEISFAAGSKLRLGYVLRNGQPYFTSALYR